VSKFAPDLKNFTYNGDVYCLFLTKNKNDYGGLCLIPVPYSLCKYVRVGSFVAGKQRWTKGPRKEKLIPLQEFLKLFVLC
jgi:hypothetical protein